MTIEECKDILKKLDGITLYSIKLEYFDNPLGILPFNSSIFIFAIYNSTISYNVINGKFTKFTRCEDFSKVEFTKFILEIIRIQK